MSSLFSSKETFYAPGEEIPIRARDRYTALDNKTVQALKIGQGRIAFIIFCFLAAFTVMFGRLFQLTILQRTQPEARRLASPSSVRADIVDRNGTILAISLPIVDLYIDARKVENPKEITRRLVKVLPDLDYQETYRKIASKSSFKYLKRNLTPQEQNAVNRLGIPFLDFETRTQRIYPQGALFSHVLGLTNIDDVGVSGVEKAFDEQLSASSSPLRLSVDANVQELVRSVLMEYAAKFETAGAAAIVMDVNTQEVLSMVSLPDYDPNQGRETLSNALFNRAALGIYEAGSIMKVFAVALGLESGKVKPDDMIDATKPYKLANYPISDYRGQNRPLTVAEVLIHSSNIGSSKIALMAGGEKQKEFMGKLGFLSPLVFELPEKARPKYPSVWRDINTVTISYGYGLASSPLHVLTALSALVNGGYYRPPTLLLHGNDDRPQMQVLSEKTSRIMRHMMRAVVDIGSGKNANVKGYLVGGKTGSAEMQDERGRYIKGSLRTSFIAAFPMDKPKYALIVMMENPKKTKETFGFNTAGWNVVPCAGKIIEKIAPYLGVAPRPEEEQPPYIQASYKLSLSKRK